MPVENQVIIIYEATKKYLIDVEVDDIMDFEKGLFEYIDMKYPGSSCFHSQGQRDQGRHREETDPGNRGV